MHHGLPGDGTSRTGRQGQETNHQPCVQPQNCPRGEGNPNGTRFRKTCSQQGCFQLPRPAQIGHGLPTRQGRHLRPRAEGPRHCGLGPSGGLDPCRWGGAGAPGVGRPLLFRGGGLQESPGTQAPKAAAFLAASALPGSAGAPLGDHLHAPSLQNHPSCPTVPTSQEAEGARVVLGNGPEAPLLQNSPGGVPPIPPRGSQPRSALLPPDHPPTPRCLLCSSG